MKIDIELFDLMFECVTEILEDRVGVERPPRKNDIRVAKKDTCVIFSQLEDSFCDRKDLEEFSGDDEELFYYLSKYIY